MRKRIHRFPGVILMILLLTAQTMGWCRAYVCDCFGPAEVTALDHCHGCLDESHQHEQQSEPCHHECGSHCEHEMIGTHFAATPVRGHRSADAPPALDFVIAVLPPLSELTFRTAAAQTLRREHDPCFYLSRRPRLTVALLI